MNFWPDSIYFYIAIALLAFIYYEVLPRLKNAKSIKNELNTEHKQQNQAISEADVYIAYGRIAQAIDILEQALAKEPNNFVIENKLKEIKNSDLT